jgi:hypothetical protein
MIHAAMAIAKPGDVIIVDGKGDLSSALMGEIMCQQCVALGVAAVVIDGAVRDSVAIRELGLPMYAAGLNPNGPTKFVPGRLNHPISIGGVTVNPGDLLVGDADGVTGRRACQGGLVAAARRRKGGGRDPAHRRHQEPQGAAPGLARRSAPRRRRHQGRGNVVSSSKPAFLVTGADLAPEALALLGDYEVVFAGKTPTEDDIVALCKRHDPVAIIVRYSKVGAAAMEPPRASG